MTEETLIKADAIRLEIRSLEAARTASFCILFHHPKLNLGDGTGYHYKWVAEIHDKIHEEVDAIVQKHIDNLYNDLKKL